MRRDFSDLWYNPPTMEKQRPSGEKARSSQETSEMRYSRLRTDVEKWIGREQAKRRRHRPYASETDRINPEHLTEIDLRFWEKLQSLKRGQPLPMEDWERYEAEFVASAGNRQAPSFSSRIEFRASMGNAVAVRNII